MIKIAEPLSTEAQKQLIVNYLDKETNICSGIKACTKEINKQSKGTLILSADTSPMDIIVHLPALCEEKGVKYVFVESKQDLKNKYTCVFISKKDSEDLYESINNKKYFNKNC